MTLSHRIATVRKALVTLVGIVSALLTANLLPAEWAPYVSTAIGIATVVLTYQVPNAGQVRNEVSVSIDSEAVKALIDERVKDGMQQLNTIMQSRAVRNGPQAPGVADHAAPE